MFMLISVILMSCKNFEPFLLMSALGAQTLGVLVLGLHHLVSAVVVPVTEG